MRQKLIVSAIALLLLLFSFQSESSAAFVASSRGEPQQIAATSQPAVKKSRTSICHAKGTTYYNQTKHYTAYSTLKACIKSGGRLPKR